MTYGAGKSHLAAVVFYDEGYERDVIRIALRVSLKKDVWSHDYTFELLREQWQKMLEEDKSLWVKALDEIMTRRSDRAYYHVRNRIAADYGEEAVVAEEAKWGARWGGTHLRQQERKDTTIGDIDRAMEGMDL
jgi:hypothetical protein